MKTLYEMSDNAMRFLVIEDIENDRCRLLDWDLTEEETEDVVKRFKAMEIDDDYCVDPEICSWIDGVHAIRYTMNGFTELAWCD